MGKVIGIVSSKGGSGKTVSAVNIAALLSNDNSQETVMKRKILLLDMTEQRSGLSFPQKNRHEKWLMNNQTRTQKEFDTR